MSYRKAIWQSGQRAASAVIFAPHALCWTDQCFAGNGAADVRAVLDVQQGRAPRVVVNPDVLETAAWRNRLLELGKRFAV